MSSHTNEDKSSSISTEEVPTILMKDRRVAAVVMVCDARKNSTLNASL